jgi:hypothetical protein
VYILLGRTIEAFHAQSLSPMNTKWMTKIFVAGDILSFVTQAAGEVFFAFRLLAMWW